ncbi:hypothetical protein [Pseudaestuariivita atlantica]|uniref:hypothetical protein n=1 Tax=Pseudaestuariivita atlantica TaxID=1317121 RepID=UPI00106C5F11|nr:hypothetical protein [Pseudaestuariivita atlantica]
MAKVSVNLDDDLDADDSSKKLKAMTAPLPSVSRAKSSALKDAPRVQFSFTNVPQPIKEAFAAEANKRGITKKELLYHCLRAGGIDVPEATEIDGRRR